MIGRRKKEAAPCSVNGAVAASIKLVQNNILTQFILQTRRGLQGRGHFFILFIGNHFKQFRQFFF
jgi:hypothetical protein